MCIWSPPLCEDAPRPVVVAGVAAIQSRTVVRLRANPLHSPVAALMQTYLEDPCAASTGHVHIALVPIRPDSPHRRASPWLPNRKPNRLLGVSPIQHKSEGFLISGIDCKSSPPRRASSRNLYYELLLKRSARNLSRFGTPAHVAESTSHSSIRRDSSAEHCPRRAGRSPGWRSGALGAAGLASESCLRDYGSVPRPLNIRSIAVAPCWSTGLICLR